MFKEIKQEFEMPKELTPQNVCFYSNTYKTFVDELGKPVANVLKRKAIFFLEHCAITYDKERKCYYCMPVKGYNSSVYTLVYDKLIKQYECNCQGFQTKKFKGEKPVCSHYLALIFHFKIKHWNVGLQDAADRIEEPK